MLLAGAAGTLAAGGAAIGHGGTHVRAAAPTVAAAPSPTAPPTSITYAGPAKLVLGAPSLVDGAVVVTLRLEGDPAQPYSGFSVHLRWDPRVFALARATSRGGIFDLETGGPGAFCAGPSNVLDDDGGGFTMGCVFLGPRATTAAGLLATITLTPRAAGCSAIHIETYGAADGGDSSTGSFLVASPSITPEATLYEDTSSSDRGVPCR
jgi:hypothetical protein